MLLITSLNDQAVPIYSGDDLKKAFTVEVEKTKYSKADKGGELVLIRQCRPEEYRPLERLYTHG